ncbi:MAG: methyltransferase [Acidobacteriia bacterium]|nr:methyltransferase [Terriglobia bacterium]
MSAVATHPPNTEQQPNAAERIMQLATGYMASISIHIVAKLGIADLLKDGPRNVSELAAATNTNQDRLYRVLRALASVGIFTEIDARKFALTPAAETLRSDVQGSIRPMAIWIGDPLHFRVYGEMMHTVKTGAPTFDHVMGKPVFEYFPTDPAESEVFNSAMTCFSEMVTPAVLDAYDFSGIGTLMDVAGGHGALLRSILAKYPSMRGIVIDLEHVVQGAKQLPENQAMAHRCEFLCADFFAAVPANADAIIMKHIIHDWDDAEAVTILRNCRKALAGKPNAKVLLVESVIAPGDAPQLGKFIDLEMMAFPGGRERTEEEFRRLFAAAGLRLTRIVPTNAPLWVVEGVLA